MNLVDIIDLVQKLYIDITTKNTKNSSINIYTGSFGVILFFELFFHYNTNKSMKEEILEQMTTNVSFGLNNIDKLEQNTAISGYTGVLWALLILKKQEVYDELDEYIEQLVDVIIKSIPNDIKQHNYDLLHGLMGKLLILGRAYGITSDKKVNQTIAKAVNQGLKTMVNLAIVSPETQEAYWSSERLHKDVVSVGLAHGQSSYIWTLSVICQECDAFINLSLQSKIKQTIRQACNFLTHRMLLEQERHTQVNLQNYFSVHQIIEPSKQHRLSWCNGGLGVCIALTRASELLEDKPLERQNLAILKALSQIKKDGSNLLWEGKNMDCGMCHGALGIFFIFYILHRKFGIPELKIAYEYWLQQATENIDRKELFLGMKVCDIQYVNDKKVMNWTYLSGLLNGAAGYGIILLSYCLLEQRQCTEDDLPWLSIFM